LPSPWEQGSMLRPAGSETSGQRRPAGNTGPSTPDMPRDRNATSDPGLRGQMPHRLMTRLAMLALGMRDHAAGGRGRNMSASRSCLPGRGGVTPPRVELVSPQQRSKHSLPPRIRDAPIAETSFRPRTEPPQLQRMILCTPVWIASRSLRSRLTTRHRHGSGSLSPGPAAWQSSCS
jgi:hypothetical protein